MKLVGILATALIAAAPAVAGAQGLGGMGAAHVGIVHAGVHGHRHGAVGHGVAGRGVFERRSDFRGRFRDGALLLAGYPFWGWDCAVGAIDCNEGVEPGAPWPGYGAPLRDATAADPAPKPTMTADECSDWVWRADLRHSVCRRPTERG